MSADGEPARLFDQGAEIESLKRQLKQGGGGGTYGGVTDDWKASVDRRLDQHHADIRALLYGLIGGFLFLIAAVGAAYVNLSAQIGEATKAVSAMQVQAGKSDTKLDLLVERSIPNAK